MLGLFDDTEDKQDFQKLLAPLVAMDPAPFETLEDADQNMLLEAAIWAAMNYEDNTKFERNEVGAPIVPTVDIDRYISSMYGPSFKIKHHTFSDADIEFVYLSDISAYVIPITSQSGSYIPLVETITSSGNTKILRIAYMQSSTYTADIVLDAQAQTVSKYMEYVMLKNSGGYYIYSVRAPLEVEPPVPEVPAVPDNTAP